MNIVRFLYTLVLFASLICGGILIKYSSKRRTMPGANYFIAATLFIMLYNGAYIGELNSNEFSKAMFWFNIEHLAAPILPYLWLLMSLDYIRAPKKIIEIAKYIMMCYPICATVSFFTNNLHHLYISSYNFNSNGYFPVITSEKGIIYIALVVVVTVIGVLCTAIYFYGFMKSIRVHRNGYMIMIIASFFPWFSVYSIATNTNYLGVDYFPVLTIITGFIYMYGIFQYRIFNAIPIAKEIIFRQSKEAILLVDLTDYIIDANDAFMKIYPEFNKLSKKNTLDFFTKSHSEFNGNFKENNKFQYELVINEEVLHYSAELMDILTEDGVKIGKMLVLSDITLFAKNQKRLEAIASSAVDKAEVSEISFLQAQIKPHFLNNTLSVISSMISRDPDAAKELVVNLSEYLVNCYSFGIKSPMVLLSEELEIVNTYVTIEKARFRERLNFQLLCEDIIEVNIPRFALQPLIENAIRHGILRKSEGGKVSLKISLEKNKVRFEVQDDGVGIAVERIDLLLNGEDNNQGVGIFNVNQRLTKYYGEGLKIISGIGQGTKIEFCIPF